MKTEPKKRRTQEERSAEMERKLLESAIACIAEYGVTGSPNTKIAKRANATGGAIQHHFGNREGLLLRVVDDSGEHLERESGSLAVTGGTLEERVGQACDATWRIVSSRHYLAILQILLAVQDDSVLRSDLSDRLQAFEQSLDRLWTAALAEVTTKTERIAAVRHIAMGTYRGLAVRMLFRPNHAKWSLELDLLKEMLVNALRSQPE